MSMDRPSSVALLSTWIVISHFARRHRCLIWISTTAMSLAIAQRSSRRFTGRSVRRSRKLHCAMQQWERANPIHKHGGHRYAPEEFGMSEAFIDEQCRRYDDF